MDRRRLLILLVLVVHLLVAQVASAAAPLARQVNNVELSLLYDESGAQITIALSSPSSGFQGSVTTSTGVARYVYYPLTAEIAVQAVSAMQASDIFLLQTEVIGGAGGESHPQLLQSPLVYQAKEDLVTINWKSDEFVELQYYDALKEEWTIAFYGDGIAVKSTSLLTPLSITAGGLWRFKTGFRDSLATYYVSTHYPHPSPFTFNPVLNTETVTVLNAVELTSLQTSPQGQQTVVTIDREQPLLVRFDPTTNPISALCDILYGKLEFDVVGGRNLFGKVLAYGSLNGTWDVNTVSLSNAPVPFDPNFYLDVNYYLENGKLVMPLLHVLPEEYAFQSVFDSWRNFPSANSGIMLVMEDDGGDLELTNPTLTVVSTAQVQQEHSSLSFSFAGVGCSTCLDAVSCSYDSVFWNDGKRNFPGSVSGISSSSLLIQVDAIITGTGAAQSSTKPLRLLLTLDGTPIGETYISDTTNVCSGTCDSYTLTSPVFSGYVGGWPYFKYNDLRENWIRLQVEDGNFCASTVTLILTVANQPGNPNCQAPSSTVIPTILPSPSGVIGPSIQPSAIPSPFPSATPSKSITRNSSRSPVPTLPHLVSPIVVDPSPGTDTVVDIVDDDGNTIGTVDIPPDVVPPGFDAVIRSVDDFPGGDVGSAVVDIVIVDKFGNTLQPSEDIEICLTVDQGADTDEACLGYVDETKNPPEWVCEDKCPDKDGNEVCGVSGHLTSFAVLLSGGDSKDECNNSDNYILGSIYYDLILIGSVTVVIVVLLVVLALLLALTPIGKRILYSEESMRIHSNLSAMRDMKKSQEYEMGSYQLEM